VDKMEFFPSCLEKKYSKSLDILDSYFTRIRINANREEAEVVDLLRLFLSLCVCLLVVSKSLNGSPAEQREKER
jgi:hypothetical protein